MDGIVLSDALECPTQLHSQITVNRELMPLVAALRTRSESDLKTAK
jgi:hypothetical protein